MIKHTTNLVLALLIAVMANAGAEEAKDSIRIYVVPSITVTTTRATERKSTVPFTEISGSEIKSSYSMLDMPQYLNLMPSVLTYSQSGNGIGYTNLNMRGFDQRKIAVLINGIPQNDPEDHNVYWIDFPDIAESLESIQIQRGAGLSNYGPAAIGGIVNMTTSNFVNERAIRIKSGIGWQKFGAADPKFQPTVNKYMAEFSSGLTGNYAFYGRLSKVVSQGYRDRSWADIGSYFFGAAKFDDNLTTQINIFGGPFSDGLVYNGLPKSYISDRNLRRQNLSYWIYDSTGQNVVNDWTAQRRQQEVEEFSQPHYELLNDWKINDILNFKSALFYYTGEGYFDYDGSWADTTTLRLTREYGFDPDRNPANALIRGYVSNKQFGWVPRLIIDHGDGELSLGAEFRLHRALHWGKVQYSEYLPGGYDPDYKIYSYNGIRDIFSLFGREQFDLADNFILNLEAQFVMNRYSISDEKAGNKFMQYFDFNGKLVGNGSELFNIRYFFFNPRIGINWNIDESSNAYAFIAYTSREPRMRNLYAADDSYFGAKPLFESKLLGNGSYGFDFSRPLVKPEKMVNLEIGWNYRNKGFSAACNLYLMEYFDELVKSGRLDIFGNPVEQNAPRTRHIGLELQASGNLLNEDGFSVIASGNCTISHNRIVEFDFATGAATSLSLAGNQIAGFPDFLAAATVAFTYEDFGISLQGKYSGPFKSDNFEDKISGTLIRNYLATTSGGYYTDNSVDSYFVANADISYSFRDFFSFRKIKLRAQVSNLFDAIYAAGAEGKEFFPAAERFIYFDMEIEL